MAFDDSGLVGIWGPNLSGDLGQGPTVSTDVPQRVLGMDPVQMIATGGDHVPTVAQAIRVWAWGRNDAGQLGDGSRNNRPTPVAVPSFNLN